MEELVRDYPDLMACTLQVWERYLCVSGDHVHRIPRMLRRGCIGDIVFFIFNALIRGGAQAYRHALRGGLLRLVLTTVNDSVDWSGFSDPPCSIVKTLRAYLSLNSVLSPAAHVVHELDRMNMEFHARDQKLHKLKLHKSRLDWVSESPFEPKTSP